MRMKRLGQWARAVSLCLAMAASLAAQAKEPPLAAAQVRAALLRSADWQLAHPRRIETTDWIIAPLYDGLLRAAFATDEPRFAEAVLRFGNQSGWSPRWRPYMADDHAVGHAWLDLYLLDRTRKERLAPLQQTFDYILAHPVTEALDFRNTPATPGIARTDRWTWCDSLYMGPPVLAKLYRATGDRKYLDLLDREFRYTYDSLYDPQERLFWRDGTYIGKTAPNGRKQFWSRGNGWVYAGLALLLEDLPADHPTRPFYEKLFKEMTGPVVAAQQADGLWRSSMLDAAHIPGGEQSGSAFFTFGLAWGVNRGLLPKKQYWPAVERGWRGLMGTVKADGLVGYVQPVGEKPGKFDQNSTQLYGTGAFLLAGSEILRALGGATKTPPAKILAAAQAAYDADRTPRAYARLVPERRDDLAWENDRVAFRIYGPALRASVEDSGIDAWFKKVDYPVIDKWYRGDLHDKVSYHQDHGEGYDAYGVGDTRGVGGLGLWRDGKLVTADTYRHADVIWTSPEVAEFVVAYDYPEIDGRKIREKRIVRLKLGEQLNEVDANFTVDGKPLAGLEVAVGVATQKPGATLALRPKDGWMSVWETIDGQGVGTGATFLAAELRGMKRATLPSAGHDGKAKGVEHALAILRTDADGRVNYRAGFGWTGAGKIADRAAWEAYLADPARASAKTPIVKRRVGEE